MARLGELLVAAGSLTADQIEQALRAQVMWGARLGTNLVELGFLDLDAVSAALGHQHLMPAALARHFERVDRELQLLLSPDVAQKLSVVPLVRVGQDRRIVIASSSPLAPKALAIVADELCVDPRSLIPSIAAELRIRYQLERVYDIQRPSRFMRSPGSSRQSFHSINVSDPDSEVDIQPYQEQDPLDDLSIDVDLGEAGRGTMELPADDIEQLTEDDLFLEPTVDRAQTEADDNPAGALELDDLPVLDPDDLAVPTAVEAEPSSGKERRKYVRTIADGPAADRPSVKIPTIPSVAPAPVPAAAPTTGSGSGPIPSPGALGRIAIRKVKVRAGTGEAPIGNTLGEVTRGIRRATDRDRVASLALEALLKFAPECGAAALLVVRGQTATSWKGFNRAGAPQTEVVVPLTEQGLVPRSVHRNQVARAPMTDLGPIDQLVLASLGAHGDLVIVPISISGQVLCVFAMVTEPDSSTESPESIAVAAGAAFARLMRHASR